MTITQGYYISPEKLKRVKAAAKFAGRSVTWQSVAARPEKVDEFLAKVEPAMEAAKGRNKNPVKGKRYFSLFNVASDYSLSPVAGKYQFGDLAHAKKAAQKLASGLSLGVITWRRNPVSGARGESQMEWMGSTTDNELVYRIIERRKNPVKKKRSAKQLANDKRLGAMAKERHAKKKFQKGVKKGGEVIRKHFKKKRKTNPERITTAWLEKRIAMVNREAGMPEDQYSRGGDGKLKGNAGNFYIDHAYGGVSVEQMARGGGAHNVSFGHVPKRELSNFIDGMLAGIQATKHKRTDNPAGKKATRKKNLSRQGSKLWVIFKLSGNKVLFYNDAYPVVNEWGSKGQASLFKSKDHALQMINSFSSSKNLGVTNESTTVAEIKSACLGKL